MIGVRPSVLVRPAARRPVVLGREGELEGGDWLVVGEKCCMYLNRKQESRKCYTTVIIVVVPHETG